MPGARKHKPLLLKKGRGKQVDRVVFDEEARREYLTGFHKRKVQKKEAEKKAAIAKQKRVRRETRAENRKLLAEQARENSRLVEQAYGWDAGESGVEGTHSESESADPVEYEDEEQMATVTIVEDFDVHEPTGTDGPSTQQLQERSDKSAQSASQTKQTAVSRPPSKTLSTKKTKKRKDFHYTTKSERLQERANQLARRKGGDDIGRQSRTTRTRRPRVK